MHMPANSQLGENILSSRPRTDEQEWIAELPDRLLRLAEVELFTGLGKTTIYALERQGKFPRRFKPGGAASRWSQQELIDWKEKLSAARYGR
jgi:prophage regulatory protein